MCYTASKILLSSVPKIQIGNAIFLKFDLFLFSHIKRQRPLQNWGSLPGIKQLGHEINHSSPPSAKIKYESLLPLYACMECTKKTVPLDFGSLNIRNTGKDHLLAFIVITT